MSLQSPPPFVEKFKYQDCKQINDPATKKRSYQTPDGENLPSVTTILSATKDMTFLNEWKKRVGEVQAQQISSQSSGRGTIMHASLEKYIVGEPRDVGSNLIYVQAKAMADKIIEKGLVNVSEVWAMEQSLYFPGLYSGTADLIGVHNGEPAIADYKQTNKPKKREYIEDYFIQLAFYGAAHNEVYKTNIRKGVIFMCSGDLQYQEFILEGAEWDIYYNKMLDKVSEYYMK